MRSKPECRALSFQSAHKRLLVSDGPLIGIVIKEEQSGNIHHEMSVRHCVEYEKSAAEARPVGLGLGA